MGEPGVEKNNNINNNNNSNNNNNNNSNWGERYFAWAPVP